MLRELIEKNLFEICDEPVEWEEAIRISMAPLVRQGAVTQEYAGTVIQNVKRFGPYIAVTPGVALPHAKDDCHVLHTAVCFVKFNHPVCFDETDAEKTASLFFAMSAEDEPRHLRNLKALTEECLKDGALIRRLCAAKTREEILAALAGGSREKI